MARQNTPGSPFIHDNVTNDIIGIKDADGGEKRFVYTDDLGVFFSGQIDITDTTASTSPTTGALTVAGGVGVAGDTYVGGALRNTATTASTSTTTGATVISGGLGVAGAAYVGGVANIAGVATMANVTDSTTKDNGALVVDGGVGIEKRLNVGGAAAFTGGLTSIPNASASTSNVVMGPSAGAAISGATNNVLIGSGAGDTITGSNGSVAIGQNALGAQTDGAIVITTTVAGTGMTPGAIADVQLVKDSGVGVMAVYPIVTLTVGAGGDVTNVAITTRGSGSTVPNGIVLKTDDVRVDPAWRGTLDLVPINTAVGRNALAANTNGTFNTAVGWGAMQSSTVAGSCTAVGHNALGSVTGERNTAVGEIAAQNLTTGRFNSALGRAALEHNATGDWNVAIGDSAGRVFGAGATDPLTLCNNSIFVGGSARPAANSQSNQTVIGYDAVGNGSNTTTIGNTSVTSTRIGGTATSLLAIAGDTMRITGTRNPASNAAGTAGDFAFGSTGGSTYLYYCIASGNWGRVALTTGY